ncbi:MAG: 3-oxoacyl-ACP synthase, partial [Prevotella sp.]|nr:3-oxoacyl-ACP synthase [Prevotella sp.]
MHRFRGNIMSRAVSRALDELGDVKPDAVILFNRSSSVIADREFEKTIKDDADFFPSPSLFVYTLP